MTQQVVTELVIDSETSGADRFSQSMDKAGGSAKDAASSVAGMSLAIGGVSIATVAALAGLRAFVDYVGNQSQALVDLADHAKLAGISTRELQETLFAARSKGMTEKDFVSGLDKIGADITAASRGVTDFGKLFEANGISIKNANGELKTTKQVMGDLAGLVQNASPQIQQAIAKIAGISASWVPFLKQGVEGIEAQKKAAADLGIVIDDDMIAKASEFAEKWKVAVATWDLQFKASLASILPLLIQLANLASTVIEGVGGISSNVSRWLTPDSEKSTSQLNDQINEVFKLREQMQTLSADSGEFKKFRIGNLANLVGLPSDASLQQVDALLDKLSALYDKKPTPLTITGGTTVLPAGKQEPRDALETEIDRITKHIAVTKADTEAVGQSEAARAGLRAEATLYAAAERAGFTDLEKYADRFMKFREEVEATTQELNKAKVVADIKLSRDTALLSPGDLQIAMKLKDTFNNDIPAALASTEAAQMRVNAALKTAGDIAGNAFSSFAKDIANGIAPMEAVAKAAKTAAESVIDIAAKQVAGNLLGSAFGGVSATAGASESATILTAAGATLAAAMVAGATEAAAILGLTVPAAAATLPIAGAVTGTEVAAGGIAAGAGLAIGGASAGAAMWGPIAILVAAVAALGASSLLGGTSKKDQAMQAALGRRDQYDQRLAQANVGDTSTRGGALAAQEAQFQQERAKEAAAGGMAMGRLLEAEAAERLALQKDWDKKEIEQAKAKQDAIDKRMMSAADRIFAAGNDTSTLGGALAAADRQFAKERADEMKAGGEAINDLVAAQEAERLGIYKQFNDAMIAEAKRIMDYLESLKFGDKSILSPQDQLAAAQNDFSRQLGLAQGGDATAQGSITQYASTLLDQAKSYYASSSGYADIYRAVTSALGGLVGATATSTGVDSSLTSMTGNLAGIVPSVSLPGASAGNDNSAVASQTQSLVQAFASVGNAQIQTLREEMGKLQAQNERLIAIIQSKRDQPRRPADRAA